VTLAVARHCDEQQVDEPCLFLAGSLDRVRVGAGEQLFTLSARMGIVGEL
jgi:hypothetical protein